MSPLRVGAGLSTDLDTAMATAEAATEAAVALDGEPHLIVAFVSDDHRDNFADVAVVLSERYPASAVMGCTAQGVIGGPREVEQGPAVSVWMAHLPDTEVTPFHLEWVETGDGESDYRGWPDVLSPDASILLLCDRFSFPAGHLAQKLNDERPGTIVIGGVASGGQQPDESRLLYGGEVLTTGAVAVALSGRVRVEALVSQGCRPIGEPLTVTRADRNILFELAGQRPVDMIERLWKAGTARDRGLMASAPLHIGLVVDEYRNDFERGDFLIRTVIGGDAESGVIAVDDIIEVGSTVQFHVRDPESADEDLSELLMAVRSRPSGALLFSCNGRGTNMFAGSDHDANLISKELAVPLAGFFCNGELGPIGGRNFLHSFTASLAMFVDTGA